MSNEDLIKQLIPLWYAQKKWAEELLVRSLRLENVVDIPRGRNPMPGTNWMYRTHGVGVDVYKTEESGGIDFDFDKPDPDPWRLRILLEKQYNDGNLSYDDYRELYEDEELAKDTITRVLNAIYQGVLRRSLRSQDVLTHACKRIVMLPGQLFTKIIVPDIFPSTNSRLHKINEPASLG